jgi:hypothetical protein
VRHVAHSAARRERAYKRDRPDNRHKPLHLHRENPEHGNNLVRPQHRVCHQDPVNRPRRPDRQPARIPEQILANHHAHARADPAEKIKIQKLPRPQHSFEVYAEPPQRQHVEQDVKHAPVQEQVRDQLPQVKVRGHVHRPQRKNTQEL